MTDLKEIAFAIGRIILGMVVLMEGLVALVPLIGISAISSTLDERLEAAYRNGYAQGSKQTYSVSYQTAYRVAYDKGYEKGYKIVQRNTTGEEVTSRIELRNPTYSELREFLAQDETDTNLFIEGEIEDEYVCFDFASELNNNAEANGIRAGYVRIRFKEWAHAINVFQTVDKGLVFIEPQSDKQVNLEVGQPYLWRSAGAIGLTPSDDIVFEIQVLW